MNGSEKAIAAAVLAAPMGENDANVSTVREYLFTLLHNLWEEEEGFNGKRPFGNSSWQYEVYAALGKADLISCTFDEEGYIESCDDDKADELVQLAIRYVFDQP